MKHVDFVHVNESHSDTAEFILLLLAQNGFGTRLSRNKVQALEFYSEHKHDILMFDHTMWTDLEALEFVTEVRDINPDARMILMSTVAKHMAHELGICHFLTKPFYPSELIQILNCVVALPEVPMSMLPRRHRFLTAVD